MHVCLCVYIYVYMSLCCHACMYACVFLCMLAFVYVCICVCLQEGEYIQECMYVSVCMSLCTCMCVWGCKFVSQVITAVLDLVFYFVSRLSHHSVCAILAGLGASEDYPVSHHTLRPLRIQVFTLLPALCGLWGFTLRFSWAASNFPNQEAVKSYSKDCC